MTANNKTLTANGSKYANPTRYCDIVMKGGITSGVVYPLAVCELAQTYQFKSIGGTSAGAIMAAGTAAAELGRTQQGSSFTELETLGRWLGGTAPDGKQSNLFALFQPQKATRPVFDTLIAGLEPKGRLFKILGTALRNFPAAAILGALPGLLLAILVFWSSGSWLLLIWGLISALLLLVIGMVLMLLWTFVKRALRVIPQNFYGLCSGYAKTSPGEAPPLTTWLMEILDRLAGNNDPEKPLTFGDLWGTDNPAGDKKIKLEMMTTNLTQGRPYRLPFEQNIFYFDPDEFRQFFPPKVVDWMVKHPWETNNPDKFAPLRPLPAAADLPVVVAARLSLSFPVLISAVPLYAIDFSRKASTGERKPERCWFSDGGITSNFPVHFFDRALPKWPTFGINLRSFHPDHPRNRHLESQNSWMPQKNNEGIVEWWTRFEDGSGNGDLLGFLGTIKDTMQNWRDNAQFKVPGFRDRVVHVSLDSNEGGLNLNMPPELIDTLSSRGRYAGQKLVEHFTASPEEVELSWDNHRWVRFRSTMALLEEMLGGMYASFQYTQPGDRSYSDLIQRRLDEVPLSYRWREETQREYALQVTKDLLRIVREWQEQDHSFADRAPNPKPELRITPRI